jgi:hypothetical protein
MKKISLLLVALYVSSTLFAQSHANFGLKGGLNISSINWNADGDSRLGLHLGALAHIHLAPEWALQPEVVYSAEGGKQDVTGGSVTWKNDYINIPVMVQYMFNNGFRIEAGPQLGILASSKVEDDDGNEDDADDVFKSTNISLGLGLSYLTYSGLGVGARYNLGLSEINEASFADAKGRTFQLSLFYMFDNHHKAKSR